MPDIPPPRRGRGRPPKTARAPEGTRAMLVRAGVDLLKEKGFSATCVDDVLHATGISKGSFYYCFSSKEDFGQVLIEDYATSFNARLDLWLLEPDTPPLQRLLNFVHDGRASMQHHGFRRGCLVGNLGQEIDMLPDSFHGLLLTIMNGWEKRVNACLLAGFGTRATAAQKRTCAQLARYFWIGWEGAVLRSRMEHAPEPLDLFTTFYMAQAATSLEVRPPVCQPPATPRVSPAQPAPGQTAQAAN